MGYRAGAQAGHSVGGGGGQKKRYSAAMRLMGHPSFMGSHAPSMTLFCSDTLPLAHQEHKNGIGNQIRMIWTLRRVFSGPLPLCCPSHHLSCPQPLHGAPKQSTYQHKHSLTFAPMG